MFGSVDESVAIKMTNNLLRAVVSDDVKTVERILIEHGGEISVESRDKYGKTPLMVRMNISSSPNQSLELKV